MTSILILDPVYLNNRRYLKIKRYYRIKKNHVSLGNKVDDRQENSLTKYYCIRSKLTVFKKCLMFPFKEVYSCSYLQLIQSVFYPAINSLINPLC